MRAAFRKSIGSELIRFKIKLLLYSFLSAKSFISLFFFTYDMSLAEKKWWRKLVGSPAPEPKVDVQKDFAAIIEFLQDLPRESKALLPELKKLEELEKESHVARPSLLAINLEMQAKIIEKVIDAYEALENDVDINGIRVKRIVHEFLKRAQSAGLSELVQEKKKSIKWQCKW